WKVNEYITNISFTNFYNDINRNISFDYIEMEDVDFIPELTTSENIYLQDVLKMGIWLIYELEFTPLLFHETRSPIDLTYLSLDAEKAVY
ncbi:hypothetical protein B5M19_04015, partial [Mesomycoplasma hyopneumoniae]|uniref:hypothetical protein n=1 Tax=Mesomycoplasma hyopneumoniae TaxID=2099 RepID=UPI000B63C69E